MSDSLFSRQGRRVLICVRGQCAESSRGRKLEQQLLTLIEQHGLDAPEHPQHVSCRVTNCLAVCNGGPVMIVHPEGVKYRQVDEQALELIFEQHILKNKPVEALKVTVPPPRRIG